MAGSMRVIIPLGVTAASASFDGVRVGAGSASSSNRDCSVSLSVLRYAWRSCRTPNCWRNSSHFSLCDSMMWIAEGMSVAPCQHTHTHTPREEEARRRIKKMIHYTWPTIPFPFYSSSSSTPFEGIQFPFSSRSSRLYQLSFSTAYKVCEASASSVAAIDWMNVSLSLSLALDCCLLYSALLSFVCWHKKLGAYV